MLAHSMLGHGPRHALACLLVLVLGVGATAQAPWGTGLTSDEDTEDAPPTATLELHTDHAAVAPGDRLRLLVRIVLPEAWHVYWTNPGDSGMPTVLDVSATAGSVVSEPRFAGPIRFEEPGGIVSFGYAGDCVAIVDVDVPADASIGTSCTLAVDAEWFLCKEICTFGGGRAVLEVAIERTARRAAAPTLAMFDEALARLPRPWHEAGLTATWRDADLELVAPHAVDALAFFPAAGELAAPAVASGPRLEIACDAGSDHPPRARGVLSVSSAPGTRWYRIDLTAHPSSNPEVPR